MFNSSMVETGEPVLSPCGEYKTEYSVNSWRCCMCSMTNEVPQLFDWDSVNNKPGDRWARAELNHAVVEFVAPAEYMVRAPQPLVYVFLIDVSHTAVQSGKPSFPELIRYFLIKL